MKKATIDKKLRFSRLMPWIGSELLLITAFLLLIPKPAGFESHYIFDTIHSSLPLIIILVLYALGMIFMLAYAKKNDLFTNITFLVIVNLFALSLLLISYSPYEMYAYSVLLQFTIIAAIVLSASILVLVEIITTRKY